MHANTLPRLPKALLQIEQLALAKAHVNYPLNRELEALFPKTWGQPALYAAAKESCVHQALSVGVVFSGGQAPGGHNVIAGLFDALKTLNAASQLIGFLNGPNGLLEQQFIDIVAPLLLPYRNQGGFDLLGSGRTKIETERQLNMAATAVQALSLDGLVIIGGDDSNSNAARLAEYFLEKGLPTRVIGVPKTIDGDLKTQAIESSFGFDTATKLYAHLIGNIQRDALSAKKYYHFIKLMGRTASHIALECALNTHPNYTLISEEMQKKTLAGIVGEIATLVEARASQGKTYGVILIPEGFLEFIPECKALMQALNVELPKITHLSTAEKIAHIKPKQPLFALLPNEIQHQLLLERDPHGNVNVSKIESERLLIQLVKDELASRCTPDLKFNPQPHFLGYEGRSAPPSCFDANYCYALGQVAAVLIDGQATGYMAALTHLTAPPELWQVAAVPLTSMLAFEERGGKRMPVIQKALVDLHGAAFKTFKQHRKAWSMDDDYCYPLPIQYFGPPSIVDTCTQTLKLEKSTK